MKNSVETNETNGNESCLYCDGCYNASTEKKGWASVVDFRGHDVIGDFLFLVQDLTVKKTMLPKSIERYVIQCEFGDVKQQQNNGAELLGLVVALRIACSRDASDNPQQYTTILCDSKLMTDFWSLGRIAAATKNKMDPKKLQWIEECIRLRKQFEMDHGRIVRISGDDNLADLGFHQRKSGKKRQKTKQE